MNRSSWLFLAAALAVLILGAASGLGRLGNSLLLLALGCASLVISFLLRRRAHHSRADVPDTQFLEQLGDRPMSDNLLLAERRHVARVLGFRPENLSAHQNLEELARAIDFVGSFSVALNDISAEIEELYKDADITPPEPLAETVGDLVVQLARARRLAGSSD